jgi:hypothetical protein
MRPYLIMLLLAMLTAVCVPAAHAGGDGSAPAPPPATGGGGQASPNGDAPIIVSNDADVQDVSERMDSLKEDLDDLIEPVDKFEQFDQCMFLMGVSTFGKPSTPVRTPFTDPGGTRLYRPLLAMDMRGLGAAEFNFMAFPGEEPPQIECNEDAGGVSTSE